MYMYKIGIILFQNMRLAPFLKNYLNILKKIPETKIDVIYLDRIPGLHDEKDDEHIAIKWKAFCGNNVFCKMYNCATYPYKVKKIIKKNGYDFLIVLTTMPAVLLCNFLKKNYAKRYIVDVRDYTREHIAWYKKRENVVFSNSALNVISSPGFKSFLPENSYYIMHNINWDSNVQVEKLEQVKKREKIRISYIGSIQYKTQCKKLIDLVKNDCSFEFFFYGNEMDNDEIKTYIDIIDCDRIKMMGTFKPTEKQRIYNETSLVFNCYGNDSLLLTKAISNKHYDGAMYQRPLLVSPQTLMEELAGEFAYSVDFEKLKDLVDLKTWFYNIDEKKFSEYTKSVIDNAIRENLKTEHMIEKACGKGRKSC